MKRIHVTDEYGTIYQSTYPKRAKGLVKKGRARYVTADTICLLRPPVPKEEPKMLQTTIDTGAQTTSVTLNDIFAELQKIREDTAHIALALEKLEKVPTDGDPAVCQEKIQAIYQIAEAREKTNQALVQCYTAMLSQLAPPDEVEKTRIA